MIKVIYKKTGEMEKVKKKKKGRVLGVFNEIVI